MAAGKQESEKLLRDGLLRLLRRTSSDRITVKELCLEAGVTRSTFYLHYSGIEDLIEKTEDEILDRVPVISTLKNEDIPFGLLSCLRVIKENSELVCMLMSDRGNSSFIRKTYAHIFTNYSSILPRVDGVDERTSSIYTLGGILALIKDWIGRGFPVPEEELASSILRIAFPPENADILPSGEME